jgi:hypothetical protein
MPDHFEDPRTLFWLVVILSLPTYATFFIAVFGMLHPNPSAYLLIPLTFISPVTFVSAALVAFQTRRPVPRQSFRASLIVVTLAFLAGVATISIIRMS